MKSYKIINRKKSCEALLKSQKNIRTYIKSYEIITNNRKSYEIFGDCVEIKEKHKKIIENLRK